MITAVTSNMASYDSNYCWYLCPLLNRWFEFLQAQCASKRDMICEMIGLIWLFEVIESLVEPSLCF